MKQMVFISIVVFSHFFDHLSYVVIVKISVTN